MRAITSGAAKGLFALLAVASLPGFAQTGPGGSWSYPVVSLSGTYHILYLGTDFNQPAGGNAGYVGFDYQFGGQVSGLYYTCSWGSAMLIPFYNLSGTAGTPTYGADINPAGKAMFNQLLTTFALGKPVYRVDFFVLTASTISDGYVGTQDGSQANPYHRPCMIKLLHLTP
jgi:hypothetical protein